MTKDYTDVYGMIAVKRQDLLEVNITNTPAAGQTYPLQLAQNNFLNKDNVFIYGVEMVSASELAISPLGATLIPASSVPYVMLDLFQRNDNLNFARHYPTTRLRPSLYNGWTQYFKPRTVDLNQSIFTLNGTTGITQGMSLVLNVYYKIVGE